MACARELQASAANSRAAPRAGFYSPSAQRTSDDLPEPLRPRSANTEPRGTSTVYQYDALVVRPVFAVADFGAQFFDPRVIDGAVLGMGGLVTATSSLWRRLQTGNVQHYALSFLVGALVLLGYYVSR